MVVYDNHYIYGRYMIIVYEPEPRLLIILEQNVSLL